MRRASSVILRRDSKIYLAQRSPSLRFFGGFWACVGGKVSAVDDADAQRTTLPELPFDLQPFAVAAMRELFEELALEISDHPLAHPEEARQALLAGASLIDQVGDDRVRAASRLRPVLRIQTPEYNPIRFDTQFFLLDWAHLPHEPEVRIACDELAEGRWAEASEWMAGWRAGEFLVAPPVLLVLQRIAEHGWNLGLSAIEQLERELNGWMEGDSETGKADDSQLAEAGVDSRSGSNAIRTTTSIMDARRERVRSIHPIFYNPAAQLLPLRTPTLPPATHTNCYLVGQDPAYLIDPATTDPVEQDRLIGAIERALPSGVVPQRRLRAILLTHHHPDHIGAVERVRKHFGLPVWAHPVTQQLLSAPVEQPGDDMMQTPAALEIDRTIEDGEVLSLGTSPDGRPGWSMRAVFTPGHAAGHLCFLEDRYGSLFAGDMVSTVSSILVRRSDGDMAIYMESLERLTKLPISTVFPAHGPGDSRGTEALLEQLAHRRAREIAIVSAIDQGADDIDAVVHAVYQDVPASMHALARLSVESVCVKLGQEGRIPIATVERLLT